jgi:hypothetical protein
MSISQTVDTILCPKVTCQFAGLICATDISLFLLQKVTYETFCITYSTLCPVFTSNKYSSDLILIIYYTISGRAVA